MLCASTIIVLSATTAVLGWLVHHQRKAMDAQKIALEATRITIEALKTQADLKVEPLQQSLSLKDAAIEALQNQRSASAERKALVEDKLQASEEKLKQLLTDLPVELSRLIQGEVAKEKSITLRTTANLFYKVGYYTGVMSLASMASTIQSVKYSKIEKENVSAERFAIRLGVEYLKDSILFLNRERRVAAERSVELFRSLGAEIPDKLTEQLEQLYSAESLARNNGFVMDPEVEAMSSIEGFTIDVVL